MAPSRTQNASARRPIHAAPSTPPHPRRPIHAPYHHAIYGNELAHLTPCRMRSTLNRRGSAHTVARASANATTIQRT
ncbi:MAG: hypothetical protein ACXVDA_17235, partial [Ktedonobacterales bacterium]